MTDEFYVDPSKPDPRSPNRPTHPDFAILSNVVQGMDLRSSVTSVPEITGVDPASLLYAIEHRFGTFGRVTNGRIKDTMLTRALYLDAFTLGMKYAQAKALTDREDTP